MLMSGDVNLFKYSFIAVVSGVAPKTHHEKAMFMVYYLLAERVNGSEN